jgi:hypothetical protein
MHGALKSQRQRAIDIQVQSIDVSISDKFKSAGGNIQKAILLILCGETVREF